MKKGVWIVVAIIVVILGVVVYLNKHAIKTMLTGYSAPATTTQNPNAPATTTQTQTQTGAVIQTLTDPAKGAYLAGANGMSLYVFDKDTKGVSNCTGGCLSVWPPYTASSATATLPTNVTVITRSDGTMQYAYKGLPLYYYASDAKSGDVLGDGINGVWHLAKP